MKTTLDIPDKLLREAMQHAGTTTKRDAVVVALEDFNQRRRQAEMIKHLGTFKDFMTVAELSKLRRSRAKRHGHD